MGIEIKIAAAVVIASFSGIASAAQAEMGTGIPNVGVYSQATGPQVVVWSLSAATVAFPNGCANITLTPTTMGWDTYKMAVGILTAAQISGRRVRFYAHQPRDGGCGVDYVQLEN